MSSILIKISFAILLFSNVSATFAQQPKAIPMPTMNPKPNDSSIVVTVRPKRPNEELHMQKFIGRYKPENCSDLFGEIAILILWSDLYSTYVVEIDSSEVEVQYPLFQPKETQSGDTKTVTYNDYYREKDELSFMSMIATTKESITSKTLSQKRLALKGDTLTYTEETLQVPGNNANVSDETSSCVFTRQ